MRPTDQQASPERYVCVPRTLIFVTRGDRVLLLKGAQDKRRWAGCYNGVGGHVEPGEDVWTAARRELEEETGLSADLRLVGIVSVDTGCTPGVLLFVFRGENPAGKLRPSAEGSLHWVPVAHLDEFPLVDDLYTLLPRVLSMPSNAPPFAALYRWDTEGRLQIRFAGLPEEHC